MSTAPAEEGPVANGIYMSHRRHRAHTIVNMVLLIALISLGYFHFFSNPLPWPDWGNAGFVLPDTQSRQVVIDILRDHHISPDWRADTRDVSRAIYRSQFPFLLDVASDHIQQQVNNPTAFIAIACENPKEAAALAERRLKEQGYEQTKVVHAPDFEMLHDSMSCVVSDAFPGLMIVFRWHITDLQAPERWTDDPRKENEQ